MWSKTKRTSLYVLFALCCFFSVLGSPESSLFIPSAYAAEFVTNGSGQDEIALLYEKRQYADAITSVYKYVTHVEANNIVENVYKYSEAYGLQPSLLFGIIAAESAFKRRAVSKEGAAGYTQVIARYHKDKLKGRNIYRTDVNIEVGAMVFAECMANNTNLDKAFGCYNGTSNKRKIKKFRLAINKRKDQLVQLAAL